MISSQVTVQKNRLLTSSAVIALITLLFASACKLFNALNTQYIGNNYIPPATGFIFIVIALMYCGVVLLSSRQSFFAQVLQRLALVYSCLWLLAFLTDSVQYTPFPEIDKWLLQLDSHLYFNTNQALNWLFHYPKLVSLLTYAYAFLQIELLGFFLILVVINHPQKLHESLFLLLSTALIGFAFYYFFPTIAPAGVISNHHFYKEQLDTSLKFKQIHQHLTPTTIEGGLIGMPSFHCIWALICQYYVRDWPYVWWGLLPFNSLLLIACVLLGWHYLVDVLAGIALFYLCLYMMKCKSTAILEK